MKATDDKNQKPSKPARKKAVKQKAQTASNEKFASELVEPRWSVVSFDECLASRLTYERAVRELKEYAAKKVSGLCIITDEAAAKIAVKK